SDADGQTLTYTASGLPAGATFNSTTHQFTWTPSYGAQGGYSARFRVTDNAFPTPAADSETVAITVSHRAPGDNQPPVLDPQTDRAGVAGVRMQFRVTGHDPEGAAVAYAGLGLPSGAAIDAASGMFDWTPAPNQIGIHPVTFTGTD